MSLARPRAFGSECRSVRVPKVRQKHEPTLMVEGCAIEGFGAEEVASECGHLPSVDLFALPVGRGQFHEPAHFTEDSKPRSVLGLRGAVFERLPRPLERVRIRGVAPD